MKQVTLGIIGNGKSANRYHLPFILQRKDKFKVKTIYQRNISHDEWKKIEDVIYTDNLNEMLNDPEIDLIVISTPSSVHYSLAKQVLEANKNCVVEKPFTETLEEAKVLFALAKSKGLMIQCYQNRRFDSDLVTAQDIIRKGTLGDILELELSFDYERPEVPESRHEFSRINSFYYGHACHSIDQVIHVFGKPNRVVYDVRQLLGEGRMNDYFDLDLFYDTLKVSIKSSFFRVYKRPSLVLVGKKGSYIKVTKDIQEDQLKQFMWPDNPVFGIDDRKDYGTLIYVDNQKVYHEEKVETLKGDYGKYYDYLYETMVNQAEKLVKDEHTLWQLEMLEEGIKDLK
jgi:predicted dehydrogenase